MSYFQSTYHSRIYRDFREIDPAAYRQIIHFYEEHEEQIKQLEFNEYFECLVAYVVALFEIGAYQKHLLMVDVVIECSINNNIQFYRGEDLFQKMLFKKAASLYNLIKYDRADYILRELIRIDPYDRDAVQFLKKCLRKKSTGLVNRARALSIFLFLLAATIISVEVLLVRPFYPLRVEGVEMTRNLVLLTGLLVMLGGTLLHRWKVDREVAEFVASIKHRNKLERASG